MGRGRDRKKRDSRSDKGRQRKAKAVKKAAIQALQYTPTALILGGAAYYAKKTLQPYEPDKATPKDKAAKILQKNAQRNEVWRRKQPAKAARGMFLEDPNIDKLGRGQRWTTRMQNLSKIQRGSEGMSLATDLAALRNGVIKDKKLKQQVVKKVAMQLKLLKKVGRFSRLGKTWVTFAAKENTRNKKEKETGKKRKVAAGVVKLGAGAYLGQQAVRSGIPRLAGVRLESHSTSNKKAREILKNGGIVDPDKSGTGAIRALEGNTAGTAKGGYTPEQAKGKVYITGIHKDAGKRTMPNPLNPMLGIEVDPKKENALQQVMNRKDQRLGYRAQSMIDWDKVNEHSKEIERLKSSAVEKKSLFMPGQTYLEFPTKEAEEKYIKLTIDKVERLNKERIKGMAKAYLMPWKGKSLYIGGS